MGDANALNSLNKLDQIVKDKAKIPHEFQTDEW